MYRWETALTTRDENRVVRPMEWGFEWLDDFIDVAGLREAWSSRPSGVKLGPRTR